LQICNQITKPNIKKTTTKKLLKNIFKTPLHFYFSLGIVIVSMSFFISFGQSVDLFKRDISIKNSTFTPNFVFQKKSDTPIALSNQKQNNKRRNSHNKSRVNNFLKKKDVKIQSVNLFAGLIILMNQQNTTLSKNTYYFFNFISSIFRPPHF